jgi:hypothetical protein
MCMISMSSSLVSVSLATGRGSGEVRHDFRLFRGCDFRRTHDPTAWKVISGHSMVNLQWLFRCFSLVPNKNPLGNSLLISNWYSVDFGFVCLSVFPLFWVFRPIGVFCRMNMNRFRSNMCFWCWLFLAEFCFRFWAFWPCDVSDVLILGLGRTVLWA